MEATNFSGVQIQNVRTIVPQAWISTGRITSEYTWAASEIIYISNENIL